MLDFLLFDVAKLRCNNPDTKKKHFARLAKEDYNEFVKPKISNPFTKLGGSSFIAGTFRLTHSKSVFVCYYSTAACAAARRAMGTRKGEQLT